MLWTLLIFLIGVFLGSRWTPAITLRDKTIYFDYSAKRGVRNSKKIYAFK